MSTNMDMTPAEQLERALLKTVDRVGGNQGKNIILASKVIVEQKLELDGWMRAINEYPKAGSAVLISQSGFMGSLTMHQNGDFPNSTLEIHGELTNLFPGTYKLVVLEDGNASAVQSAPIKSYIRSFVVQGDGLPICFQTVIVGSLWGVDGLTGRLVAIEKESSTPGTSVSQERVAWGVVGWMHDVIQDVSQVANLNPGACQTVTPSTPLYERMSTNMDMTPAEQLERALLKTVDRVGGNQGKNIILASKVIVEQKLELDGWKRAINEYPKAGSAVLISQSGFMGSLTMHQNGDFPNSTLEIHGELTNLFPGTYKLVVLEDGNASAVQSAPIKSYIRSFVVQGDGLPICFQTVIVGSLWGVDGLTGRLVAIEKESSTPGTSVSQERVAWGVVGWMHDVIQDVSQVANLNPGAGQQTVAPSSPVFSGRTVSEKVALLEVRFPGCGVAHVTLKMPERIKAYTIDLWRDAKEMFDELSSNPECRAVVISGNGKSFCTGIVPLSDTGDDIQLMENDELDVGRKARFFERVIKEAQVFFTAIEQCEKPVISAIHSHCIGAGVDIICSTDIRYAAVDAVFSIKEVDIGMAADVGTLNRIGYVVGNDSWLREVAFTERDFGGGEALQHGLISSVFPSQQECVKAALALAARLAEKSPIGVQGTKKVMNYARGRTPAGSLGVASRWNMSQLQSSDHMDSALATMNKKKASYKDM